MSCDGLLIDDVHVLAVKEATQTEFISLMHALVDRGRQVVMTSSLLSQQLPRLESGIRTGFERGLFVDIQPLDYEMCKAVVLDKAAQRGSNFPKTA